MKIIIPIVVGIIVITGLFFIFVPLLKDKKYREDYTYIKSFIDQSEVNFENFLFICSEFDRLNKNNVYPEQTIKLRKYFMDKYQLYHSDVYNYHNDTI
jgi:hypothetical protein